jgi:acetyl-CoA carboxylase carboxyltransferase component
MLDARNPRMRVAWPSGEWGSLPLDGGIEAAHAAELGQIERSQGIDARKARWAELDEEYRRLMNPIRTANAFGISEIVDPAKTRPLLCQWTGHVYASLLPERVAERLAGKLSPVFA